MFEEILKNSDSLVCAECCGLDSKEKGTKKYKFKPTELISGIEIPENFTLSVSPGEYYVEDGTVYKSSDILYENGKKYLLPLTKQTSVFYSEDIYFSTGNTVIELSETGDIISAKVHFGDAPGIDFKNIAELKLNDSYSCRTPEERKETKFFIVDSLKEAYEKSDYVLRVKVGDIFNDADDRTVYNAETVETIKSPDPVPGEIIVALPKNSANTGEEYIILLSRSGPASYVFVVSNIAYSIVEIGSTEEAEINRLK